MPAGGSIKAITPESHPGTRLPFAVAMFACVLFVAYAVSLVSNFGFHPVLVAYGNFLYAPLYPLAAWLAYRAAQNPQLCRGDQRFWYALTVACLFIATGSAAWSFADILGRAPMRLLTDGGPTVYYIALLWALMRHPAAPATRAERAKFVLDIAITLVAGGIISWYLLLAEIGKQGMPEPTRMPFALLYPAADLALAFATITVFGRGIRRRRAATATLYGALLVSYVADTAHASLTLTLQYRPGSWIDLAWAFVSLLLCITAYLGVRGSGLADDEASPHAASSYSTIPYLIASAGFVILVIATLSNDSAAVLRLAPWCAVLTFLVIGRQIAAVRQIGALSKQQVLADARYRALVQHSTDVTLILDSDWVVQYYSPSLERVFQSTMAEFDGGRLPSVAHPEDRDALERWLRTLVTRNPSTAPIIWRMRDADTWRSVESVGSDLRAEPSVNGIVIHSRDVSDRVSLEEQLRHAHKMEAVGLLAGGVAHDFNNLLAAITMNAQLLRGSAGNTDEMEVEVREIERAAQRGAALTNQLLAFSRREPVRPEVLSPAAVFDRLEPMLRRLLPVGLSLHAELDHACWTVMDRTALEQVIMNLVLNARDAQSRNVTVHVSAVGAWTADDEGELVVEVRDDGIGIAPEARERLFEPFFTTKEQGKGTGLGLATVYGIVTRAGGRLEVDSTPGKGSSFRVVLPRATAPVKHPTPLSVRVLSPTRSRKVLVVDDEEGVRSTLGRLFKRNGFDVTLAADGAEALELIMLDVPDVLLTDVMMPNVGGLELAQHVRALHPALPIVFMSGYVGGDLSASTLAEVPNSRFLAKPFQLADALEAVSAEQLAVV